MLNKMFRNSAGLRSRIPVIGEKIICLKNSTGDGDAHYNGEIFVVGSVSTYKHKEELSIYSIRRLDDTDYTRSVIIHDDIWFDGYTSLTKANNRTVEKFDFAYAITVHKSQGSEWDNVLFYDENVSYFLEQKRFRYTAVTRSSNKLTIVNP